MRVTGRFAGTCSASQRPSEALLLADRVIVFSSRPARIIWDLKGLYKIFNDHRPPEIVREGEFVELCEQLREKLKKPSGSVSSLAA